MRFSTLLAFSAIAATLPGALGGLLTYGVCQTGEWLQWYSAYHHLTLLSVWSTPIEGCNAVAVACYGAAGVQFGTVLAPAAPATIAGCNAALGT